MSANPPSQPISERDDPQVCGLPTPPNQHRPGLVCMKRKGHGGAHNATVSPQGGDGA